ncbi:MAG: hypothetical protein EBR82_09170 [Caulobacteraceae bacterium]|nr:hypothetical protein [Caulobacteraceae bacterium]
MDELQLFADQLNTPSGLALRDAGAIMMRRLEQRGQSLADLTDGQLVDLLHSAFLEAATPVFAHIDPAALEREVDAMFASIRMEIAATAPTTERVN